MTRASTLSHRALVAALALGLSLVAPIARAQTTPSQAEHEALAEARRGLVARREGRDDEARQAFERSLSLSPRASVRAQLGFALQALGRWVDAEAALLAAVDPRDPWVRRHRATIDAALVAVRAHLGTLTLSVQPADATLRIDGVETSANVTSRLAAGTVTVSARREGYYGTERAVVIRAGDTLRESFDLRVREPEPTPPPVRSPSPPLAHGTEPPSRPLPEALFAASSPRRETRHWGGPAVVAGVGALSVGAGVALWVARNAALDDVLALGCVETTAEYLCSSASDVTAARELHGRAGAFAGASTAALVAGGALIAVGAGWLLVEGLRSRRDEAGVRATPGGVQWSF